MTPLEPGEHVDLDTGTSIQRIGYQTRTYRVTVGGRFVQLSGDEILTLAEYVEPEGEQ